LQAPHLVAKVTVINPELENRYSTRLPRYFWSLRYLDIS
jgi:hypothetical protein